MSKMNGKKTHTHTQGEDQREWHRMTRMTGPDCAVMCNLINTHTAPIWCPSGGWRHARGREHCRGEPGSTLLSGGYAPDSAKAEGSSIVDEPGEG